MAYFQIPNVMENKQMFVNVVSFTAHTSQTPHNVTHLFVLVGESVALYGILTGTSVHLCQAALFHDTHVVLQAGSHVTCQEREWHQLRW
jgi:hypothetical protein